MSKIKRSRIISEWVERQRYEMAELWRILMSVYRCPKGEHRWMFLTDVELYVCKYCTTRALTIKEYRGG